MFNRFRYAAILLMVGATVSCCPEGDDFGVSSAPKISVDPVQDEIGLDSGQALIGGSFTVPIRILNVGNGDLTISDIALRYTAPDDGDQYGPAFSLEAPELPQTIQITQTGEQAELVLNVIFTRQDAYLARRATLVITSDSVEDSTKIIEIVEEPPSAVGDLSPKAINFGTVNQGDVSERFASLTNTGTSNLVCDRFKLTGHPDFTLHVEDKAYPVSEITAEQVSFEETIVVEPSTTYQVRLTFGPQTPSPAQGVLVLFCNDVIGGLGHTASLTANEDVPCIQAEPGALDFGGQLIGVKAILPIRISNCGDAPLVVSAITLAGVSQDFSLNFSKAPIDNTLGIPADAPLEIAVNDWIDMEVEFVPDLVNGLDGDNKPIPDTNILLVENNSFEANLEIPISGVGVDVECPTAIAGIDEGEQVVPQTTLHLKGDGSFSSGGADISGFIWVVTESPDSNTSQFIPAPGFANPVYDVNVAGSYT
ncbi:MAG: hypothetical protein ACI9OJ_004363, partial [Myxococcota bacterium]